MESTTLAAAGYQVRVICPVGKGYEKPYEVIDGIHIYRHPLPPEQSSAAGYIRGRLAERADLGLPQVAVVLGSGSTAWPLNGIAFQICEKSL